MALNRSFQPRNSVVVSDSGRCHHFVLLYIGGLHGHGEVGFEHAIKRGPADPEFGSGARFIAIA